MNTPPFSCVPTCVPCGVLSHVASYVSCCALYSEPTQVSISVFWCVPQGVFMTVPIFLPIKNSIIWLKPDYAITIIRLYKCRSSLYDFIKLAFHQFGQAILAKRGYDFGT